MVIFEGPIWAINTVNTGYRNQAKKRIAVDAHGVCKTVYNGTAVDLFIPTKSDPEWSSFRTNTPPSITLRDCSSCQEIYALGGSHGDGEYQIDLDGTGGMTPFKVWCDMTTEGGGWLDLVRTFHLTGQDVPTLRDYFFAPQTGRTLTHYLGNETTSGDPGIGVPNSLGGATHVSGFYFKTKYPVQSIRLSYRMQGDEEDYRCGSTNWVPLSGPGYEGGYAQYEMPCLDGYFCIQGSPTFSRDEPIQASFNTDSFRPNYMLAFSGSGDGSESTANCGLDPEIPSTLNSTFITKLLLKDSLVQSCKDVLTQEPESTSGVYTIYPGGQAVPTYCDMTTDGGGWTLVWSNTRGGTNKPITDLTYAQSTTTLPRCSKANASDPVSTDGSCSYLNSDLETFNYFLGLDFWNLITKNRDHSEFMYRWANDYGSSIDQAFKANRRRFEKGDKYRLWLTNDVLLVGATTPSMLATHSGKQWTATDQDNDVRTVSNCATDYDSPNWYGNCWNGAIQGGGENLVNGYYNAAYYNGIAKADGLDDGTGGGNGWMYIREYDTPADCAEALVMNPGAASGIFEIDPDGAGGEAAFNVYCDMETEGGGWTLIMKAKGDTLTTFGANDTTHFLTPTYSGDTTTLADENALGKAYSSVRFSDVLFRSIADPTKYVAWRHGNEHDSVFDVLTAGVAVNDGLGIGGSVDGLDYNSGCTTGTGVTERTYGFFVHDTSGSYGPHSLLGKVSFNGYFGAAIGWGSGAADYASGKQTSGGVGTTTNGTPLWSMNRHVHGTASDCAAASDGLPPLKTHGIFVRRPKEYLHSCKEILDQSPGIRSGNYIIDPDGVGGFAPFTVYCDMVSDGGGWTRKLYTSDIFNDDSDVALFRLEGNAKDDKGNYTGAVGGSTFTTGRFGQGSVHAGGSFSYQVSTPGMSEITGNNSRSFSMWLNWNTISGNQGILGQDGSPINTTHTNNTSFYLYHLTSGYSIKGHAHDTLFDYIETETSTWVHIVVTWDSVSGNLNFYRNGVLISTKAMTAFNTAATQFLMGSAWSKADFLNFDGMIDQVRVFNRALTLEEITELYKGYQ